MRENYYHWEISMNDIYYNKIHYKNNIIVELNPLFELIIATKDYMKNIQKDFFDNYINKKICSINIIKDYEIFECDPKFFDIKEIQKFPSLYLYNSDLNHAFDMKGEELFIELNNKIYFKIIFTDNIENNKWILGKIFLRKYPAIFSPSNRVVGFYIKPNEGKIPGIMVEDNDIKKNKNKHGVLFYVLIVFISLLFTCFGLIIGRKLVLQRRKKMNELIDDYYQYDSNEKKVNKNENENKVKKEISPKEMESKI